MLTQHEVEIRVRYQETDGQGRLHHANYLTYFELGRTELLRAAGFTYRDVERQGVFLVVAEMTCRYYLPARYDDLLRLRTTTVRAKGARVEHEYKVFRGDDAKDKANAMRAYWVPGVNNLGKFGRWAFAEFTAAHAIEREFGLLLEQSMAGKGRTP